MAFGRLWAGRLFGTNVGNVFAKLEGADDQLSGTLRFADAAYGVVVYEISGTFQDGSLKVSGKPTKVPEGIAAGDLTAVAILNEKGNFDGEWETTLGTAGTFVLFPHDPATRAPEGTDETPEADQLHTRRHAFGAIDIDKGQLVKIGERMKADFPGRKVIVTIRAATEQSRFLEDFAANEAPYSKAEFAKLFVQMPEPGGVSRTLTVEFGPGTNFVMAQSADEAWALGIVERLKRDIHPHERSLAINIRRVGIGINQLLLFWAVVFLPELPDIWWRVGFLAAVIAVIAGNTFMHNRFVPTATIRLGDAQPTLLAKFGPSVLSWFFAIVSSVLVSLITAYAKGWITPMPPMPPA